MRLVVIESPYAGDFAGDVAKVERHLRYLRACMHDCLKRGEAPFASHGLYTQPGVLDDNDPADRELGIQAGFAWRAMADATVVYTDCGTSRGMEYGIRAAKELRTRNEDGTSAHVIEYRTLGPDWDNLDEQPTGAAGARSTCYWGCESQRTNWSAPR